MKTEPYSETIEAMTRKGTGTNAGYLLKLLRALLAKAMPMVTKVEATMMLEAINGVTLTEDVNPETFAQAWASDIRDANLPEGGDEASAFADRVEKMTFDEVAALVTAAENYLAARHETRSVGLEDFFRIS